MFQFLGPVRGKVVLDLGCGYHPTPLYLAAAGAERVYACDISPNAVSHIQKVAAERGFGDRIVGVVCAAEQLPFPADAVDLVHGEAVLHHLALPVAAREIARVMRPGGRAAFKDPLGQNRLLEVARDYLRHSAKATDRPMTFAQLDEFGRHFRESTYRGFGLVSIAIALLGRSRWQRLTRAADAVDASLLGRFPSLQRFCQYVVTCCTK
jgi:SAM-dependent methyltransferase